MQLITTVLQKLSLASLLTLGTLATVPTVVRSAPVPTLDQIPYITSKDEAVMMPTYTAAALEPMTNMAKNTIVDVAVANGSFKTLTAALKAAGLIETLKGNGPFTVFAPTDAAFAKLPKGTVEMLLKPENKATLVRILTYHVVSGNVLSTDLKSGQVSTLEGSPVNVMIGKDGVMINKSTVQAADVRASNGVIHVIDNVLMPQADMAKNTIVDVAVANGSFKTLTAALKAAGLVETLQGDGPFTVFAPTDAAFAKLPAGTVEMLLKPENKATLARILTYHVVSGNVLSTDLKSGQVKTIEGSPVNVMIDKNGVMINQSTVKAADVKASNGVIHVIDTVLMPPSK